MNDKVVTDKNQFNRLTKQKGPERYDVVYRIASQEGQVTLPTAPKVGDLLIAENGEVIVDPSRLADIEAGQHQVVAYRVSYRVGEELGEVRMTEKPQGQTLQLKNGQVIMADASSKGAERKSNN